MFIIRLLCLLIGLNNPTTYGPMQILALKKKVQERRFKNSAKSHHQETGLLKFQYSLHHRALHIVQVLF